MKADLYQHRVQYYETDRMDCVHHSNYIRWFEEARTHLMEAWGFPYPRMESLGIVSPVLEARAVYRSMTRFGDVVEIETRIEKYTGVKIVFSYVVRDEKTGEVRCTGETHHCFLGEQGRPVMLRKACPEYHERILTTLGEK